jgi:nucleotide-binding universal stress UspA family protein
MQGLGEVETQTIVCSGAVVAQTILDVACSHDVELIVMCSRGYTGLKRWMEGSETQKLVSKTPDAFRGECVPQFCTTTTTRW